MTGEIKVSNKSRQGHRAKEKAVTLAWRAAQECCSRHSMTEDRQERGRLERALMASSVAGGASAETRQANHLEPYVGKQHWWRQAETHGIKVEIQTATCKTSNRWRVQRQLVDVSKTLWMGVGESNYRGPARQEGMNKECLKGIQDVQRPNRRNPENTNGAKEKNCRFLTMLSREKSVVET
jgi:hypothetical protein